jgi:hypothetical protein
MVTFRSSYFIVMLCLLVIEICIALFLHDPIIRPYIGDLLVVGLIYCFVKSFLNIPIIQTAILVLLFSFVVEGLQYYNIVEKLGLQDNKVARTIIGTSFAWMDIYMYVIGIILVLVTEYWKDAKQFRSSN